MKDYDRVLGCLYGMATGDSLGVPSSFQTREQIKQKWKWIDTFLPPEKGHIFHDGLKAGEYTDDTEQALALMHSFERNHKVVPFDVADEIMKWADRVKGKYASPLGPSTERALKAIKMGASIEESGIYANTNGAAMRIAPLGILHGLKGTSCEEMAKDVYLTCMPTHNTKVCVASACAIAWGVALCIRGETDIEKIIKETARAADIGEQYGHTVSAPSISKRILFLNDMVRDAEDPISMLDKIYDLFGGGDLAADSVPVALAMFVLGKGDVKTVNEYCVNLGGDCDTNGAMAGAMAGAMGGIDSVPKAWCQTIDDMNEADLKQEAQIIIDLYPVWQVANV